MRILHVIPYMHPSAGGPPVVVENLVRETAVRGHVSEIVSTALLCADDEEAQALLLRLNQLTKTRFLPRSKIFTLFYGFRHQIEDAIGSADIVHLHTLWDPINALVRRACARQSRPYLLMPHGMLDPYSLSVKRWRKAAYLWAIERKNIECAQRLIYTTEEEGQLAATVLSGRPQGAVIPLGGDPPSINAKSLASKFLNEHPRARGKRQLLFLGRIHFKKGLDRILSALPTIVTAFPDVMLTIAGDGDREHVAELRVDIANRGLTSAVMFTGRLDGALKWGAYASAELFLLPSRQENFAITVAEAMQMGLPVIVSKKVNTWSDVETAGAGVVLDEQGIEKELEAAIRVLLLDNESLKRMGERGQEYARANLTWANAASRLLQCYGEVIGGGRFGSSNF
jgi:glycosyltransferase involved in cell wall biosynthesis